MANVEPQPTLRGTGPEDVEEKIPGFPVFEISTLSKFLTACTTGVMPGGIKTSLPLFPEDEMKHFYTKYEEWATAPWSSMQMPAGPFGAIPGASPAPIIRVMHVISGLEDILQRAMASTSMDDDVERSFKSVKSLIWFGMAPVSEARWRAKGLDERENIEEAMALIRQVIHVFQYLRKPEVQGQLRRTHNKIWTEIDVFQDACSDLRTSKGEPKPEFSMTSLWQEYVDCHWNFMEVQARAWIFKRLKILFDNFKGHFLTVFLSGRQVNETQGTIRIDHYDMLILNHLLDMYVDADLLVHRATDGFISTLGVHRELADINSPEEQRTQIYSRIENQRMSTARAMLQHVIDDRIAQRAEGARADNLPVPEFLNAPSKLIDREFGHKGLQAEIDNPPPLRMETWVTELAKEKAERFGFVIYRLSYDEGDEAWEAFMKRFKDGLTSGWEGIIGAADIRRKETPHWIDGRSEKISEGDLGAARVHFKTFRESPSFPTGLSKAACLGITPNCVASFKDTRPNDRKGDYRGFLHAMDPLFEPPKLSRTENPGYDGTFKIIDQLVWTDLYARNSMIGNQGLRDYWSLAAQHPWGVYVGPTTGVRRRAWREMQGGMSLLLKGISRGRT